MRPQAKVRRTAGCNPRLVDITRSKLQPRADSECVVLPASIAEALELHVHCEVVVPEVVAQKAWGARGVDQQEILVAIAIYIRDRNRGRAR